MMDNYPDYYESPLTGIEQLLSKIPTPLGLIKKGLDALGDKLPVNKGAIFQNELLGQGIKLDNIGRIVTDNYNTPEGIMAGYNPVSGGLLNMLTGGAYGEPTQYGLEKSVAERQSNIRDTLQDKYGLSEQQIDDVLSEIEETGTYTGDLGFNQTMGKTTNLFKNLSDLGKFDLINKNALERLNLIFEQKLEEKQQKKQAEIDDINRRKREETDAAKQRELQIEAAAKAQEISRSQATQQQKAIERDQQRDRDNRWRRKWRRWRGVQVVQDLEEDIIKVISVLIQILLFKWLMAVRKKLKIFNLVMTLKVEKLQVYSNLKQLMRFTITKVLLLQVVTMLKKMVNLLWLKTAHYPSRSIRYL
jgi:hypothetical protein